MPNHTLYSYRRCPYAMRARMALVMADIQCDVHEIDFRYKPADMLAASPKGTVPVLILTNDSVIDESRDIIKWAMTGNNEQSDALKNGSDLIDENDDAFKAALDRYKYPNRFEGEDCTSAREEGIKFLELLNARLTGHAFLMGDQKTIIDICIFPFIRQFANVDREWFDRLDLKPLQNWLMKNLESDIFKQVMTKHKETPYVLV